MLNNGGVQCRGGIAWWNSCCFFCLGGDRMMGVEGTCNLIKDPFQASELIPGEHNCCQMRKNGAVQTAGLEIIDELHEEVLYRCLALQILLDGKDDGS